MHVIVMGNDNFLSSHTIEFIGRMMLLRIKIILRVTGGVFVNDDRFDPIGHTAENAFGKWSEVRNVGRSLV
jgi:hypothetical protein